MVFGVLHLRSLDSSTALALDCGIPTELAFCLQVMNV